MSFCTWQILCDITVLLTNQKARLGLLRQQGEFELIVPTLRVWSQQLNALSVSLILDFNSKAVNICEIIVCAHLGPTSFASEIAEEAIAVATRVQHIIFRFSAGGRFDADRRHAT